MARSFPVLLAAVVVTAAWGSACLDFPNAYDRYCATTGTCDGGSSGNTDGGDGGATDGGGGGEDGGQDAGTCAGGAACSGPSDCCNGAACLAAGDSGTCEPHSGTLLSDGYRCIASDQCANGLCEDGVCVEPVCRALYVSCSHAEPCCDGMACRYIAPFTCRQNVGTPCTTHEGCSQLNCANGVCATCVGVGGACENDPMCCGGRCEDGTCENCFPNGAPTGICDETSDCCGGNCAAGGRCCGAAGAPCSIGNHSSCCSNVCNAGTCT